MSQGDIQTLFARAGCAGQLCVTTIDGTREIALDADKPAVGASVIKVLVALVVQAAFERGILDPGERVTLPGGDPVPGPAGFSLYSDDVQVSLRDLVVPMLTISDNAATDALLHRVGLETVNRRAAELGLKDTLITSDLRTLIDSMAQDAGFGNWAALTGWAGRAHGQEAENRIARRVARSGALDPVRGHRTTARDMAMLLRLIWTDQAGPPRACDRVRQLMERQLTRNRLASGFGEPARVAAKSGSLAGVVRNEIGVITYPGGERYAAAVFTQARAPGRDEGEGEANAVIGRAAAAAVERLCEPRLSLHDSISVSWPVFVCLTV